MAFSPAIRHITPAKPGVTLKRGAFAEKAPPFNGALGALSKKHREAPMPVKGENIAAGATAMEFKTYTVLTLMVVSSTAFAWQPLTYPVRSQSPYQRSVDTALCYAEANKTKVDITRESQIPPRKAPPPKTSSTGVPSRPPLPSSTFSAAPAGASMPAAATEPGGASAPAATTAATAATEGASAVRSAGTAAAISSAMAALASSGTSADLGASDAVAGSSNPNAASSVALPPLPAPEPPMTRYWAAYGACMQAKGYVVAQ